MMNFLKKTWGWTGRNLEWICVGVNVVLVVAVLIYTTQAMSASASREALNLQLINNNTTLVEQNKNLSGLLNKAGNIYHEQNDALQRQGALIDMQREGISELLLRIKQLERLLKNDSII